MVRSMSKGDGHGMSIVYAWQLFGKTSNIREVPSCIHYDRSSIAESCKYFDYISGNCGKNEEQCVYLSAETKSCKYYEQCSVNHLRPVKESGSVKNSLLTSKNRNHRNKRRFICFTCQHYIFKNNRYCCVLGLSNRKSCSLYFGKHKKEKPLQKGK